MFVHSTSNQDLPAIPLNPLSEAIVALALLLRGPLREQEYLTGFLYPNRWMPVALSIRSAPENPSHIDFKPEKLKA